MKLTLFLALFFSLPVFGQDGTFPIDSQSGRYIITSVIYTRTHDKALVGIVEKNQTQPLATFVECSSFLNLNVLKKSDLKNCKGFQGKWFETNEENVEKIDSQIARNLKSFYRDRKNKSEIERSYAETAIFMINAVIAAENIQVLRLSSKKDIISRSIRGFAIVGIILNGLVAAKMTANEVMDIKFHPLEERLADTYQDLLKIQSDIKIIDVLDNRPYLFTYELIRDSILAAIPPLNEG